jgi:hypothetical protein
MAKKPSKFELVVEGEGPVPEYNYSIQRLREEEADRYWYYGFGTRFGGTENWDIKRLGKTKSHGGFKRIGKTK